ncbi:MAG: hypothetical protein IPG39_03790 [Bacteroidetes bacterium]|nr:hypothetical protein [Bacteroidota bacterium]
MKSKQPETPYHEADYPCFVFKCHPCNFVPLKSYATHLMGGSMTYEYMGMVGADQSYLVTLKIYRYCDASAGGTAPLDASMFLGIYNQDIIKSECGQKLVQNRKSSFGQQQFCYTTKYRI